MDKADRHRFWSYVDRVNGPTMPHMADRCWPWTGDLTHNGYGSFWLRDTHVRANRVAWALAHPDDLHTLQYALHLCDNPRCCRPSHLYNGTASDNMLDRAERGHQPRKLDPTLVAEITQRLADGEKARHLALEYNITQGHIYAIMRQARKKDNL